MRPANQLDVVKNLLAQLANCQIDGEGECDEHGFVEPDIELTGGGDELAETCPHCGEEVEVFTMTWEDATTTLQSAINTARHILSKDFTCTHCNPSVADPDVDWCTNCRPEEEKDTWQLLANDAISALVSAEEDWGEAPDVMRIALQLYIDRSDALTTRTSF